MGPYHLYIYDVESNSNTVRFKSKKWSVNRSLVLLLCKVIIFSLLAMPVVSGELNRDVLTTAIKTASSNNLVLENRNNPHPQVVNDFSELSSEVNAKSKNELESNVVSMRQVADWNGKDVKTVIIPASFDGNYTENVNIGTQWIYLYNYTQTNQTTAVRIHVSCDSASDTHPVMFSARQQEGILSWSLPLDQSQKDYYSYNAVGRTLCPISKVRKEGMDKHQHIFIQVSSSTKTDVRFHLNAKLIDDFLLSHKIPSEVSVVTAQPKYFMYMFPDGVDQVLLRVTSKSKTCMIVSVQDIKCPVRDLENNIGFEGKHQTMTTQAALFLQRSDFKDIKGFYLVLLVRSNDEKCSGKFHWYDISPRDEIKDRSKTVSITIKEATTTREYVIATVSAVGILLGFYLLAFLTGLLYNSCGSHKALDDLTSEEREHLFETSLPNIASAEHLLPPESPQSSPRGPKLTNQNDATDVTDRSFYTARAYGALNQREDDEERRPPTPKPMGAVSRQQSHANSLGETASLTASLNEEEIDFLPDVESEKDIYRSKKIMYVSDLARKKMNKLRKYYNQYIWNLVSLAIFYALPVVQLVLTYQRVLLQSGNEDLCYYNFDCANPLKSYLSAFNNVFSNIGYVMLGFLFILIVRSRDILQSRAMVKHKHLATKVGIPQHYGIFYAMGFALVMEGVMSGSYHVCPNYSNFQFDTSFMYIIACLCMLRIYQNRHPDISAKSHTAYFSMAFVILIALIGVLYSTNIFWIFYALVHMFATVFLSAQVYFMGRWSISWSSFKRFTLFLINDCRSLSPPVSPNRFIMLLIGNIINWTFALYGAIVHPSDFASYLLAIFIGNLLLYCLFYVIMKILSREGISLLVLGVMVTCFVLWSCSLYFFFQHVTSWQKTASGSREGNRECILFNFFDSHDVWHFLSAFSLFFSFMILLLLDDNIALKPRNQIAVF